MGGKIQAQNFSASNFSPILWTSTALTVMPVFRPKTFHNQHVMKFQVVTVHQQVCPSRFAINPRKLPSMGFA